MNTTTAESISTLNSLLRGEMAALQTYGQVFEKLKDDNAPGVAELRKLRQDHRDAAEALQRFVKLQGDEPSHDSGPWGAFAKTVTGTAKVFGNTAALKALKEGEEHGVKEYQEALDDQSLPAEARALIRDTLLPRQRQHITTLDRLMKAQ
jgi:uncharacterized protein (TIGR02284 family)